MCFMTELRGAEHDVNSLADALHQQLRNTVSKAGAHVQSEFDSDAAGIMATISQTDPCWVTFDIQAADGREQLRFRVMTTQGEAQRYYGEFRSVRLLTKVAHARDIVTEWYMMSESITEAFNPTIGASFPSHHVVLFVMRDDGIAGEIIWPRWVSTWNASRPGKAIADAEPYNSDWPTLERRLSASEEFMERFRSSDAAGISRMFRDECFCVLPGVVRNHPRVVVCHSRNDVEAYYRDLFDVYTVAEMVVLNRIVEDWYTFAELSIQLQGGRGGDTSDIDVMRSAFIFGTAPDGELVGQVGQALPMEHRSTGLLPAAVAATFVRARRDGT
jgi:hypothetical protein